MVPTTGYGNLTKGAGDEPEFQSRCKLEAKQVKSVGLDNLSPEEMLPELGKAPTPIPPLLLNGCVNMNSSFLIPGWDLANAQQVNNTEH